MKIFRFLSFSAFLLLFVCSCAATRSEQLQRFEYQKPEMGLPFRMVFYAPDKVKAEQAVMAAFKRIQDLNDIMSDYDEESELSKLSDTSGQGKAVRVSDDLWAVLQRGQELAEHT